MAAEHQAVVRMEGGCVSLPVPLVSVGRRPSAPGKDHSAMMSIWVESLSRTFDAALDLLAAALHDCTDDLWEASMWHVPTDLFGPAPPGPDGTPVTDPAARHALAQRRSTPWSVAWHALEVLDYDLTGEFGSWAPPPPFAGNPHWLLTRLPAPWTRAERVPPRGPPGVARGAAPGRCSPSATSRRKTGAC